MDIPDLRRKKFSEKKIGFFFFFFSFDIFFFFFAHVSIWSPQSYVPPPPIHLFADIILEWSHINLIYILIICYERPFKIRKCYICSDYTHYVL